MICQKEADEIAPLHQNQLFEVYCLALSLYSMRVGPCELFQKCVIFLQLQKYLEMFVLEDVMGLVYQFEKNLLYKIQETAC